LETLSFKYVVNSATHSPDSLLVREINWLETWEVGRNLTAERVTFTPYSLGKLIDWKHDWMLFFVKVNIATFFSPYSLGKLIDWKRFVA
jgi:hypothetical protein